MSERKEYKTALINVAEVGFDGDYYVLPGIDVNGDEITIHLHADLFDWDISIQNVLLVNYFIDEVGRNSVENYLNLTNIARYNIDIKKIFEEIRTFMGNNYYVTIGMPPVEVIQRSAIKTRLEGLKDLKISELPENLKDILNILEEFGLEDSNEKAGKE